MGTHSLLSPEDQNRLKEAIARAELNTSGEIRLHIDSRCKGDVIQRAWAIFGTLKMHQTQARNAVLIYIASEDHKLAIIGDQGIHSKVGDTYWDTIKNNMINSFKEGHFVQGLTQAIEQVGLSLKDLFPYQSDDVNELSDEISFGSNDQDS